jgi:hypothetical protein
VPTSKFFYPLSAVISLQGEDESRAAEVLIYIREACINNEAPLRSIMFGYKSAGIVAKMESALSVKSHWGFLGRSRAVAIARGAPGIARKNETYIAPTQFTVVAMPFFRWNQ